MTDAGAHSTTGTDQGLAKHLGGVQTRGESAKALVEGDSTVSHFTGSKTQKSWTMRRKQKGSAVFQGNCND